MMIKHVQFLLNKVTIMTEKPDNAFILAAGKGTRLRPLTNTIPKPLVPVKGRAILDHTIDKLIAQGIQKVTINHNYLGDRIIEHCKERGDIKITLSEEKAHLETGGGVKKALHTMNNKPFYLINGDALWENKESNHSTLQQLSEKWDSNTMDVLLLLQPLDNMHLTEGVGDYDIDLNGQAFRNKDKKGQYMFTGVRIAHPRLFNSSPDGAFSFLELMDKAESENRLYGLVHDGTWHHISTPEDLNRVEKAQSES